MKALVLCVLLLGACGGNPMTETKRDPLSGTDWAAQISGFNCSRLITFSEDGQFASGIACVLQDGQNALQAASGTYTATGDGILSGKLTLNPTKASCPDATRAPVTADYTPGTDLTIGFPTGAIDFVPARASASGSGGTVTYGCFDDALHFTASPMHSL